MALVKREQEEAERARKKEEEEKKQQREEQQRRKRMLEAAFEGDVEEMKAILKEVKMSSAPQQDQVGRGDAPCLFLLHFQAVWPWNMSQGPLRDVLKYPVVLFHNGKGHLNVLLLLQGGTLDSCVCVWGGRGFPQPELQGTNWNDAWPGQREGWKEEGIYVLPSPQIAQPEIEASSISY